MYRTPYHLAEIPGRPHEEEDRQLTTEEGLQAHRTIRDRAPGPLPATARWRARRQPRGSLHVDGADEPRSAPTLGQVHLPRSQEEAGSSGSSQHLLSLQSKSCDLIYSGWARMLNWTGVWGNAGCEPSVLYPSNFSVDTLPALPVRLTLTLAGQAPAGSGAGQEGEKHWVGKIKRQPTGATSPFSQVSKGQRKKATVSSLLCLGSAVPSHHLLTLISWLFPDKSLSPWVHLGDGIRRERKWEGGKKEGGGRCFILGEIDSLEGLAEIEIVFSEI